MICLPSCLSADFRYFHLSIFLSIYFLPFSLLCCPSPELALKRLTAADPEWVARLSLPLTSSYKDNVFCPDSPRCPEDEEAARQEKPRTFETFGKGAGADPGGSGTRLASTFLSEMSTLFEMILSQKVQVHSEGGAGLLRQLSARGHGLGLGDAAAGL